MLVGLQGSGKTTMAAKLALLLRKQGQRPLLVAADPYRPAAVTSSQTLGEQLDVPVYHEPNKQAAGRWPQDAVAPASRMGSTYVIVDTAGRPQIDEAMMDEVAEIRRRGEPAGDAARRRRHDRPGRRQGRRGVPRAGRLTGAVLTKMDGDARGGAALSIRRHRRADQVRGHRRAARRARAVPSGSDRHAHPGHGRRAEPDRARPGERRRGGGRGDSRRSS